MRNIVKALRAIGYQVVISNLNEEETAVWNNMVASATSQQQAENLPVEDKVWWSRQIAAESCTHCLLWGESDRCSKH